MCLFKRMLRGIGALENQWGVSSDGNCNVKDTGVRVSAGRGVLTNGSLSIRDSGFLMHEAHPYQSAAHIRPAFPETNPRSTRGRE